MAFLNKQEDVIDIKLTSYGKKMLSKGLFRPVFYGFYDDDVIYKVPEEQQNSCQDRIKQDLVIRTLAEAVGVENRFEIQGKKILEGESSLYEQMEESPDPISNGKLVQYELSCQNLQTQKSPSFNLKVHDKAKIDTDLSTLSLSSSGGFYNIPQLVITPEYTTVIDRISSQNLPDNLMNTPETLPFDLMSTDIEFLDGSKIKVIEDKIIISLIENNVPYSNENFEIEVYEVLDENDKEQNIQLETLEDIAKFFTIKTDESIDNYYSHRNERNTGLFGSSGPQENMSDE